MKEEITYNDIEQIDISKHIIKKLDGTPAVYVGTYAKYNEGNIFGAWLDLTSFSSYEDFLECCAELHKDENSPEFMAQDFDGFNRNWYTEGFMSEREFNLIQRFEGLEDDRKEAFEVFEDVFGSSKEDEEIFRKFDEAYCGEWRSESDFAYNLAEELCLLDGVPDYLKRYFDYEAFARDIFIDSYYFDSGYVFRREF